MPKKLLISMLQQGNTGSEILSILDAIVNDECDADVVGGYAALSVDEENYLPIPNQTLPTMEEIAF
jgi:hypothetical protein